MDIITYYTLTFVLYSFIGYLCEVAYCSIGQGHLVNRGFLYGPWLPIYGFGGLIVDIFLVPIAHYPIIVFITAIIPNMLAERLADLLRILFAVDLTLSVLKMSAFKKALMDAREKAKAIEERVQELKKLGKNELSEEFRNRLTQELEDLREKTRISYNRIISAFPSATSKHDEVKLQLQNIHTWAKERREASREMKAKIMETKAEYKEKVKTIDENAKGRRNG